MAPFLSGYLARRDRTEAAVPTRLKLDCVKRSLNSEIGEGKNEGN
jgi:hypothetical protein